MKGLDVFNKSKNASHRTNAHTEDKCAWEWGALIRDFEKASSFSSKCLRDKL